jgi:hypothetical protein
MPRAWAATARRAPFIRPMAYRMSPKRRLPSRMAGVFVYWISHVGDAWIPILFSMRRILTVASRSTTNMERPRASVEPSSLRARTSDTSASPFVMKRLTPLRRHVPVASSSVARVATEPRSEPASASVRTMAPETSPRAKRGRIRALVSASPYSSSEDAISWRP